MLIKPHCSSSTSTNLSAVPSARASAVEIVEKNSSKMHKPNLLMSLKQSPLTQTNVTKVTSSVDELVVKNEYDDLLDIDEMDYEQLAAEVHEDVNTPLNKNFEVKKETELNIREIKREERLSCEDILQSQDRSGDSDDDAPLIYRPKGHGTVEKENTPEKNQQRYKGAPGPAKRKNIKSSKRLKVQSSPKKKIVVENTTNNETLLTDISHVNRKRAHNEKINKKQKKKSNQGNRPDNIREAPKPISNPSESSTKQNHITADEERPTCSYCGKQFYYKSNLIRHLGLHKGEKFKCDYCQKEFPEKRYLINHIRTHLGVKSFKCRFCNKKYADHSNLSRHLRIHGSVKPFACNECRKEFTERHHLISHLRAIHLVGKLLTCSVCGKNLGDKRSLTRHSKIHDSILMPSVHVKPFTCNDCGRKFTEKHSLKRHHLRKHLVKKSFTCNYCKKRFTEKRLKSHLMNVHMVVNSPKCSVCGKLFANKINLSKHLKIHTGEKPFSCDYCGKKFTEKHHSISHFKRIHKVEAAKK